MPTPISLSISIPQADSKPAGYVTPGDSTARVVYRGADNHIHELFLQPNHGWAHADLTGLFRVPTGAAGDPYGYVTPGARRVAGHWRRD